MKIIASQEPRAGEISHADFSISIRPAYRLRNAGWDVTGPEEADYIVVPFLVKTHIPALRTGPYAGNSFIVPMVFPADVPGGWVSRPELRDAVMHAILSAFPLWERFPEKHVFFDDGDRDEAHPLLRRSILFKNSVNTRDHHSLALPYGVPDPYRAPGTGPPPISGADLDVSFQGYPGTHPIREKLARWSEGRTDLKVQFRATEQFFFNMSRERQAAMERENVNLMLRSRFVLNPRGEGMTSSRFFQTLAHGRLPIFISDAARLPLESVIDYDRFTIRVPEMHIRLIADYIHEFELLHDLTEASETARRTYVEYFAPRHFRHFVEVALATRSREP